MSQAILAISPSAIAARREAWRLGSLFGALYFVQGIAEPTEGLIAQPVRSLLNGWNCSAAQIATFSALLAAPWSLKPIYGLLTDFVPLAGYRRKSYLVVACLVTVISLLALYAWPVPRGAVSVLCLALLPPTVAVAFSDVVVDALMVNRGKSRGLTGRLQSIQWAALYGATIFTGVLGGYLSQRGRQDLAFLICALITLPSLVLSVWFIKERRVCRRRLGFRTGCAVLARNVRSPAVLSVCGFLFVWNFNPFSTTVLYLHLRNTLGFTDRFCGETVSILAVGAVAASVAYGFYCRLVPFRSLIHLSIVLGVMSTLAYWAAHSSTSVRLVTLAVGFTNITAVLIQLDLAARACPLRSAGTVFALIMAVANLSTSLSMMVGGELYTFWQDRWGAMASFNALVGLGALCTACCWLIVRYLPLHAADRDDSSRATRQGADG